LESKNHPFRVFENSQGIGGFCERTIKEPIVQGCSKNPEMFLVANKHYKYWVLT
jgi:hypothetical protein